mmetsp:Transcript_31283/g.99803  ORF Transcript_31283/g.99803 Transcript_31283/m.99803 type:complete len:216 (+) Transcript_31283:29-676(+)
MTICLYANINPGAAPGRGALHFARQPAFCASAATPALFIRTCRLPSSPSAPLKEGIARKGFSPAPDEHPSRSQISASATLSLAFSSSALLALESRAASVSPTAARAALHSTRWSRMRCPSSSIAMMYSRCPSTLMSRPTRARLSPDAASSARAVAPSARRVVSATSASMLAAATSGDSPCAGVAAPTSSPGRDSTRSTHSRISCRCATARDFSRR